MGTRRRYGEGTYNFWPVYSDLALSMVLLLILVVLAQHTRTLLQIDVQATIVRLRQEELSIRLDGLPVHSIIDGNTQIIVLSADSLFLSDSSELRPEGRELLLQVYGVFGRAQVPFTRIAVEGHADHQMSGMFHSGDIESDGGNWRLSAERAIQVAQLLQRAGMAAEKLEVVGRSHYAPVDSTYLQIPLEERGDARSGYQASLQRNRRIALRIFYSEHDVEH